MAKKAKKSAKVATRNSVPSKKGTSKEVPSSSGKKKDIKIIDDIVKEDEVMVPLAVEKSEDRTLFWFFVVVGVIFAGVLIPYFWVESSKVFEFGGIDWVVEEYEYLEIFHGRFVSLTNSELNYNVFFRTDPRTNNVPATGSFNDFWSEGVISLSPEVDACRGDLGRGIFDLSAFMRQGVGILSVESGSTDEDIANQTGRVFANCDNVVDTTLIIVDISSEGEAGIFQDENNPSCYVIMASDCEDASGIEKFIVRSVVDFREAYPN